MSQFIEITDDQIKTLTTNRLLNIFRKNRKYLFHVLNDFGFDTSNNGNNINWCIVDDDLYHHREYNGISNLNYKIKEELNKRKEHENDNRN